MEKTMFYLEKLKDEYRYDSVFVLTLSKAYLKSNRWADAKNILQEFLAKNQDSATMRGLLGMCFYMLGEDLSAKREWERAQKLNPDEPVAKTGLEKLGKILEK